ASFPGNLHLVLVLKPSSFLQRTPTDIGFRFSQEDFMIKMPVVMLSSVTDLLRFIDDNQLTSEFGGTLEFCHSDWIVLRTAIESFAVTVKEIAQMLQAFGTELAETELTDEANAIDYLLRSHTDKYRQLKDDIRSVMRQGRQLLTRLEASRAAEEDSGEEKDVSQDWNTVQSPRSHVPAPPRLLAQLRDMEMAFDGFFEKHHLKLKQYLQLLRYEQNFHEMEASLEQLTAQEREIPSVGATVAQTDQLIKDLDALDKRAQDEMSRAQIIILHGHQLAANHHYAMALIVQRCNELRHYCDVLTAALRAKRAALARTRDLLLRLEEALRWCDEGAYLLANQLMDKCQSKDGAQAALRDIEKFQEGTPPPLSAGPQVLSQEYESILTPQLQAQIGAAHDKLSSVKGMIENRQASLRKLADKQERPVQPVAPRPEAQSKSPLFSPKHGKSYPAALHGHTEGRSTPTNLRFSFDLSLPGKRVSRKGPGSRKIEVMHEYGENRSSLSYRFNGEESPDILKRHVMKELIETERIYVEELLAVLLGYRAEMDNPALSRLLPPILRTKKEVLFGNMPEIYKFHSRQITGAYRPLSPSITTGETLTFCPHDLPAGPGGMLEQPGGSGLLLLGQGTTHHAHTELSQVLLCVGAEVYVCDMIALVCFQKENFQVYKRYCQNKPRSEALWRQCCDCPFFQELLKYSTGDKGTSELQEALNAMLELLKSVNDSMHQIAITGYEVRHGKKRCLGLSRGYFECLTKDIDKIFYVFFHL
ncbi:hypothetical protein Z043_123218, partial [Scleropages formosus]